MSANNSKADNANNSATPSGLAPRASHGVSKPYVIAATAESSSFWRFYPHDSFRETRANNLLRPAPPPPPRLSMGSLPVARHGCVPRPQNNRLRIYKTPPIAFQARCRKPQHVMPLGQSLASGNPRVFYQSRVFLSAKIRAIQK
jgi:hypothetical protein